MKIVNYLKRLFTTKVEYRNVFAGGNTGNLYASWAVTNYSGDSELKSNLNKLRARSRDLERNSDYAKKFIRMVKTNVVGQAGIKLQVRAKFPDGTLDKNANDTIESAFMNWARPGVCDITGRYSFRDMQKQIIGTIARDGEVLIREHRANVNPYKYSLQLIEADHLDVNYNDILTNGNKIKMGVELTPAGRPVAYHLYTEHPGDRNFGTVGYQDRIRVPASEMIHLFIPQRISQNRGLPWMHSAMAGINMLSGYREAELVAARLGAAKGGFYESSDDASQAEFQGDDIDSDGRPINEATPGHFDKLPYGWRFKQFDPTHPTTAYESFEKQILRGISSGLDVSYNYLANDLENVNYSSIRAGVLDERDVWRDIQAWMIEHFCQVIYERWLLRVMTKTSILPLPVGKYPKFSNAIWQTRGWQWVDPLKDIQAAILAINNGLNNHQDVLAQEGKDFDENTDKLIDELEKLKNVKKDSDMNVKPEKE